MNIIEMLSIVVSATLALNYGIYKYKAHVDEKKSNKKTECELWIKQRDILFDLAERGDLSMDDALILYPKLKEDQHHHDALYIFHVDQAYKLSEVFKVD